MEENREGPHFILGLESEVLVGISRIVLRKCHLSMCGAAAAAAAGVSLILDLWK